MLDIPPDTEINESFRIIRSIGEGGMGAVYEAQQLDLVRNVALKFLLPELLTDKNSLLRFERESKILMLLKHKNLVTCYQFGIWRTSYPFIAMELLDGKSFKKLIDERLRVDPLVCLDVGIQACDGLDVIHRANFTHRDIKPENLFLQSVGGQTVVKIIDFGLAGFVSRTHTEQIKLTQTGALVGSIFYLSPELCQGQPPDHRSDIYSLGCAIYEGLTGEPPLVGDDPIGMIYKHVHDYPLKLTEKIQTVQFPAGLSEVLSKAMCKNPGNRYQSAMEFRADLEAVRAGKGASLNLPDIVAIESGESTRAQPARSIFPLILMLVGVLTAGLACFYLYSDDALLRFGNTFRSIAHGQSIDAVMKYADWLGSSGHGIAQTQFLLSQSAALKTGDPNRIRLILCLSRLEGERKQTGRQRELLMRAIRELSSCEPGTVPEYKKSWQNLLQEAVEDAAKTARLSGKGSRWYFDKDFDRALQVLIVKTMALNDYSSAISVRKLNLLDASLFTDKAYILRLQASLAQLLHMRGDLKAAAELLSKVSREARAGSMMASPTGLIILTEQSSVSRDMGQWAEHADILLQAVPVGEVEIAKCRASSQGAVVASSLLIIVQSLYNAHKYSQCAGLAADCLPLLDTNQRVNDPLLSQLCYWRSLSLYRLDKRSEALSVLAGMTAPDEQQTRHFALAQIYKWESDYQKVLCEYKTALKFATENNRSSAEVFQAVGQLAQTLMDDKRYQEALDVIGSCQSFFKGKCTLIASMEMLRAEISQRMGKISESDKALTRAIKTHCLYLAPDSRTTLLAQVRHAQLLLRRKQYDQCSNLLNTILKCTDPVVKGRAQELLARNAALAGNYDIALLLGQDAVKTYDDNGWKGDPSYLLAMADLAEANARCGKLAEARKLWKRIEPDLNFWTLSEIEEISIARSAAILGALTGDTVLSAKLKDLISKYSKYEGLLFYREEAEACQDEAKTVKKME